MFEGASPLRSPSSSLSLLGGGGGAKLRTGGRHSHSPRRGSVSAGTRRKGRRTGGAATKKKKIKKISLKPPGSAAVEGEGGKNPARRPPRAKPRGGGTVSPRPRPPGLGESPGRGEGGLCRGRGLGKGRPSRGGRARMGCAGAPRSAPRCPRLRHGGSCRRRTPHGSAGEDRLASTYLSSGPRWVGGCPPGDPLLRTPRLWAGGGGGAWGAAPPGCGSLGELCCVG